MRRTRLARLPLECAQKGRERQRMKRGGEREREFAVARIHPRNRPAGANIIPWAGIRIKADDSLFWETRDAAHRARTRSVSLSLSPGPARRVASRRTAPRRDARFSVTDLPRESRARHAIGRFLPACLLAYLLACRPACTGAAYALLFLSCLFPSSLFLLLISSSLLYFFLSFSSLFRSTLYRSNVPLPATWGISVS